MSLSWLPNAICIARIVLVAPIVLVLVEERYVLGLALIVVAGASDALDGFLAKTFDWRSELGGLLDPAADKLLLTSVFVTLTWLGLVPVGVTVVAVGRDLVIVGGAVAYRLLIGRVHGEPTVVSKLNTACQLAFVWFTLTGAAFAWPPADLLLVLGAAVVFTSATSGIHYVVVWSRRARGDSRGSDVRTREHA